MSLPNKSQIRPIIDSYWVEPGRLLAGEYPGDFDEEGTRQRIDALLEAGFDTFIDLTRPGENPPYNTVLNEQAKAYDTEARYYRFAIGDFGLPSPELMKSILDQLDESLGRGGKVYLHCWGGIGRTGTTVGCYLVRRGRTGEEALRQLAKWWQSVPKSEFHPHSPETRRQVEFVRNWSEPETGG